MRKTIIAGNWKMYKTVAEGVKLSKGIADAITESLPVEVLVCPPFTSLSAVGEAIKGTSVCLGAQNLYWEREGAFTGEVSPVMIKDVGCEYVILGHSERRHIFGETNEGINRKTKAALTAGLKPIICVGETLQEREANKTLDVVRRQITESCQGLSKEEISRSVIAYEPVWAIGTGVTASPEQAQEVHQAIRQICTQIWDEATAANLTILYGGSVKPGNIKELSAAPDIDGALVGGASLKVEDFVGIIQGAAETVSSTLNS
ncbi:MAG: triose-phosphate isomerase [Candidatus Omnitrophica bacterium]|nr:triose-phosphate isomerase [Candidatus Omnitrophota bacterium]